MSFKLGKKSVEILHNLASISSKMILVEGDQQSSSDALAKVYATARLPDSVDCSFGMYDINALLGKFRLFGEDFTLTYDDANKQVVVSDNYSKVVVPTSDTKRIAEPRIGVGIGSDESDIVFKMSSVNLNKMMEFMKVTGTGVIAFTKPEDDDCLRVEGYIEDELREAYLRGMKVKPVWFVRLDEAIDLEPFKYYTLFNTKMLDGDYDVRIRQFYGVTDKNSKVAGTEGLNKGRPNAIQFDGEFIRYVFQYMKYSENQKGMQNVK